MLYQIFRGLKYILISTANVVGHPKKLQPVLFAGKGNIVIGNNVIFGVVHSPFYFSTYTYIEARTNQSIIKIDNGVWLNNNASLISDGGGIYIGENTIAGTNLEIIDSDFHSIETNSRMSNIYKSHKVVIERNVFIGSNVKILKGVTIGENTVIANGSIVTKSLPANVIAGGNPAKIIKPLSE